MRSTVLTEWIGGEWTQRDGDVSSGVAALTRGWCMTSRRSNRDAAMFTVAVLTLLLGVPGGALAGDGDRVVYTRAEVLEASAGVVELRERAVARLELPQPHCDGGSFRCSDVVIYGQALSLTFRQEIDRTEPGGTRRREIVERGRLLVAIDLDFEDTFRLEEALTEHLAALSAPAFEEPFACMGFLRRPFELALFERSEQPVWVCRTDGEGVAADILVATERGVTTFGRDGRTAEEGCAAIAEATASGETQLFRTPVLARSVRRQEIRLRTRSTTTGAYWSDALASLPPGLEYGKRALGGGRTGSILDRKGGLFIGREGRFGGVERSLRAGPVSFDLIGWPMWAARWEFRTAIERFGVAPELKETGRASVLVAVVPIRDPLMGEEIAVDTPVSIPEEDLVERAREAFSAAAFPAPRDVESVLATPGLWPAAGDWLVIVCRDDGSARYAVAPFPPEATVSNRTEVCSVVADLLDRP